MSQNTKPLPRQQEYLKHCTDGGPVVDELGYARAAGASGAYPSAQKARIADDKCELDKYGHVPTLRDHDRD